jgi:NAD(P)-dependent dehydrogenase (short-subunit alcohol dehydrogenase family)
MGIMDGKICMVTGATSGIGEFTALGIAKMGAKVIIIGRDQEKCLSTVKRIQLDTGNLAVEYLLADLSSQAQIRALSYQFHRHYDHLDVLVNNAGGFFLRRKVSVDGFEMTFALNHLNYFLLTNLLLDALKASPRARIVNVASNNHWQEHLDFEDLQMTKRYNGFRAYGRSKLANVLFTYELSRHLAGTNITANAIHPGFVATDIYRKVNRLLTLLIVPLIRLMALPPSEGAQTSIYLASSPEVVGVTGKYFILNKPVPSDPATYVVADAQRLWDISLEMTGLK